MSDSLVTTALGTFPSILEETAFLFCDDSDEVLQFQEPPTGVAIAYDGPERGDLRLWAQSGFMRALAANMLGLEEGDPAAASRRVDALGELLNIVLGHCLTERFGESESMRMGLPRPLPFGDLAIDQDVGKWLLVEGEPVLLSWRMRT